MEKEKKKILRKVLIVIAVITIIVIGLTIFFVSNNNKEVKTFSQLYETDTLEDNNSTETEKLKYTKEELKDIFLKCEEGNDYPTFISFAIKRQNEKDYLDSEDSSYSFEYEYKVVNDDTINFYMIFNEPINKSSGLGQLYNIWAYGASYTITDATIKYFEKIEKSEINLSDITIEKFLEINQEKTLKQSNVTEAGKDIHTKSFVDFLTEIILDYAPEIDITSSLTYLSDTELKKLALNKWLNEDYYINLQCYNNAYTYTGKITKKYDGSVFVSLVLNKIGGNGSFIGSKTVKLTKEEATK